jgi:glutathione S-transferase
MISKRRLTHAVFVLLLPLLVAIFGLSFWSALLLVMGGLLWRWLVAVSGLIAPDTQPGIVLETIPASHFAEKARWCLDRLGVDYEEQQHAGILGVLFTGRTVPRMSFKTGVVRSSIGNSPQILRFLWGEYIADVEHEAEFLRPSAERLALEAKIDRCGVDLQVWIYSHALAHKDLTLHLWGINHPRVPKWQRILMRPLFPLTSMFLRRVFKLDDAHYEKSVQHIDALLDDVEARVADGRKSILGGDEINYVDITFAAITGLWLQPDNYGGGAADESRVRREDLPPEMQADIERWIEDHPRATALVERLYNEERMR